MQKYGHKTLALGITGIIAAFTFSNFHEETILEAAPETGGQEPVLSTTMPSQLSAALKIELPKNATGLLEPIDEFKPRIKKKTFGPHITPQTSPVQPDRFYGYHTGVDVEYEDRNEDIPVRAIADGTIIFRGFASGYVGVIVILHFFNGTTLQALYGHLDPASLLSSGTSQVEAGEQTGISGAGYTKENDGTRKHLHFSLREGEV